MDVLGSFASSRIKIRWSYAQDVRSSPSKAGAGRATYHRDKISAVEMRPRLFDLFNLFNTHHNQTLKRPKQPIQGRRRPRNLPRDKISAVEMPPKRLTFLIYPIHIIIKP
jgi:hypothetical protein